MAVSSTKLRMSNYICEILIGLGIGWLAGISLSPITTSVVTSVIGGVMALTSTLSTLGVGTLKRTPATLDEQNGSSEPSLLPILLLLIGLVFGSIVGIRARTQLWLGSHSRAELKAMDPELRKLFLPVLFSSPATEECTGFRAAAAQGKLRETMQMTADENVSKFAKKIGDKDILKEALEDLVCPTSDSLQSR